MRESSSEAAIAFGSISPKKTKKRRRSPIKGYPEGLKRSTSPFDNGQSGMAKPKAVGISV